MNDLLQLKGTFEQKSNNSRPGSPELPSEATVKVEHLEKLKNDLEALKEFWSEDTILNGALVSVFYIDVIAKSRRISGTLTKGSITANSSIVGAKFSKSDRMKHIITHYVSLEMLNESIERYKKSITVLKKQFKGVINCEDIKKLNQKKISYDNSLIAKTNFLKIIVDAHYVEKFSIVMQEEELKENSIITIYKTDTDTIELMDKIGINLLSARLIDDTTMLLTPDQLAILKQKAPYLISMAISDISKLTKTDFENIDRETINIPSPKNEPTIGVIDTMFDENVYFSEWVDFKNMVSSDIELSQDDYFHGTAVSSIIVDGPSINPDLDDGCGRFKVRHFGVAAGRYFSSFSILRAINEIISSNKDIKVWNLSLGAPVEVNPNFISPEAAILDKIQYENDIIFIIAGTNKNSMNKTVEAIGAPADSINSLVVNSVDFENKPAKYSRKGPVLSFFTKPDVSYYGGDGNKKIRVCTSMGEAFVAGTSFAAPWISRKMSYLIDVLGLSREVAKALIINSATGWHPQKISSSLIGHGVVPQKIDDILKSPNDEIRFILSGVSEKYDTYNYNLPVPIDKEKHPFIAKATMCYFPYCSRNQGVDYTNTELDIYFGRINGKEIKSINNNQQCTDGNHLYEGNARKFYRKWDNVKHIIEFAKNNKPKKVYDKGIWGISIKTKERLEEKFGDGIKFGIVVTLKEINGVNRIEDFIRNCSLRGWLVNRVDIDNRIDIYNIAEENIDFDDVF